MERLNEIAYQHLIQQLQSENDALKREVIGLRNLLNKNLKSKHNDRKS